MKGLRQIFSILLLAACCAGIAYSQAVNATIVGTITDASGAVVVNAKITVVETQTGVSRTGNTNESGNFVLPNVPPGTYSVTAEQTASRRQSAPASTSWWTPLRASI